MNIFYLASNPRVCAEWHCDQHCSKMIVEYAQLLSTAHRVAESEWADQVYKVAHKNHPSTLWTRESIDHYAWLYELWRELAIQFRIRRGKDHASWTKLGHILCYTPPLPHAGWQDPPQCMPDQFKGPECVEAYRRFYSQDKRRFATWTWNPSNKPMWWDYAEYKSNSMEAGA